jgi:prolyl-tRNA synthetase
MKDAYSFDRDEAGLDESFRKHEGAYKRIFERCGIEAVEVAAESGIMGGSGSQDFLAPVGLGREHARHLRER